MAREPGGYRHLRLTGKSPDHEVLVRGICIHARLSVQQLAGGQREITIHRLTQDLFVFRVHLPVNRIRVYLLQQVMGAADLEPWDSVAGEPVVTALFGKHSKDREDLSGVQLWALWLKPAHHLTFGNRVGG